MNSKSENDELMDWRDWWKFSVDIISMVGVGLIVTYILYDLMNRQDREEELHKKENKVMERLLQTLEKK